MRVNAKHSARVLDRLARFGWPESEACSGRDAMSGLPNLRDSMRALYLKPNKGERSKSGRA